MDEINRKRLEWIAQAKPGITVPDDLFGSSWGDTLSKAAQDALDEMESMRRWKAEHIHDWRPIAEASIPGPHDGQPEYWCFHCILQDTQGVVGEGFARYATDGRIRGNKHVRQLRWYFGSGDRDSRVCKDPRYFMPLPQPRKD